MDNNDAAHDVVAKIIAKLHEEFPRWEELLNGLSEAQITARQLPANLSIKDVMAHLMTWQGLSVLRLEAVQLNQEPQVQGWPDLDPDVVENLDEINAWIFETHRDQPWGSVYRGWREGFLRLMELGQAIPAKDMLDAGKYPWLKGYPLVWLLEGNYEHHHEEHLIPLRAWLKQHGLSTPPETR